MIGIYIATVYSIGKIVCHVNVVDTTTNKTIDSYHGLPAQFGPAIPPSELRGLVNYIKQNKVCSVPASPPKLTNYTGLWIALVSKCNCSFVDKVLHVLSQLKICM